MKTLYLLHSVLRAAHEWIVVKGAGCTTMAPVTNAPSRSHQHAIDDQNIPFAGACLVERRHNLVGGLVVNLNYQALA
jgi:hypothetical protein